MGSSRKRSAAGQLGSCSTGAQGPEIKEDIRRHRWTETKERYFRDSLSQKLLVILWNCEGEGRVDGLVVMRNIAGKCEHNY